MALKQRPTGDYELTRAELLRVVDERARRLLGMSGDEFARRLDAGTLPESAAVTHLAMLLGDDFR